MDEMAVKVAALEQRCKSNGHRIENLEKDHEAMHRMAGALEVMANEQKHQTEAIAGVKEDVGRLESKVDVLEQKPAKRWDGIVDKLIWAVAGAVVAAVMAGLLQAIGLAG